MAESHIENVSEDAALRQRLWSFTLDPFRTVRRPTREVRVGSVGIGGKNPIRLQSMTVADTLDTEAVVAEIAALHAAGSDIVRVAVPNRHAAENLGAIKTALRRRGLDVPLVADVHFAPQAALIAALHVEKVRINPGNYADRKHFVKREYTDAEYGAALERLEVAFRPLVLRCRERGTAMRIGANHGSLSDRILNRHGDTPLGMVESALEFVHICELHGYRDLVLSMKASDVKVMIAAYRLLAARLRALGMDYPFHLGVTEAGAGRAARIKSAIGVVTLLEDGIGDTVRVSLAEDSLHEIPVARALVAPFESEPPPAAPGHVGVVPDWDPYCFARRAVEPVGTGPSRLAADWPQRVELVESLAPAADQWSAAAVDDLRRRIASEARDGGADLLLLDFGGVVAGAGGAPVLDLLRALGVLAEERATGTRPGLAVEVPARWLGDEALCAAIAGAPWRRLSVRLRLEEIAALPCAWEAGLARMPALQYTICVPEGQVQALDAAAARIAERLASGGWPHGALALELEEAERLPLSQAVRRLLAAWPARAPRLPLVLRGPASVPAAPLDAHVTSGELRLAAALGALLADGVGDAVQLRASPDPAAARRLAFEILQAVRLRLSQADFIACPSCGRTQFDLQTTTARLEARLKHLEGLKIAVMGCIVNGPGEMADADFGYVGSGPGRIDLYVGRERVERHVPEDEADARLIDLIRRHGRWVDRQPGSES